MSVAALVPLIVVAIGWVGYLLFDIRRSEVRRLPKWAWALVVTFSVPLGGIVYLTAGRVPHGRSR